MGIVEAEKEPEKPCRNGCKTASSPYLLFIDCNRTRCEETSVAFLK